MNGRRRRAAKVLVGGQVLLGASAAAMATVRVLRPRSGRRICQEHIGRWAGQQLLGLSEVEMVVHRDRPWPDRPCFYMANHSSSLDLPILMALGMPDSRTFIKERFRWYGTLGAALALTGTFFTAPQEDHARRVAKFADAEATLRRTGESVFGSPEGTRVEGGGIGPFNRGVFHLVTVLKMPIVPILIRIPPEVDPGRGIAGDPGVVHVHVGAPIETEGWTLKDLDTHKERVRDQFVEWQEALS